jgi:hypothetical protein
MVITKKQFNENCCWCIKEERTYEYAKDFRIWFNADNGNIHISCEDLGINISNKEYKLVATERDSTYLEVTSENFKIEMWVKEVCNETLKEITLLIDDKRYLLARAPLLKKIDENS